MNPLPQPPQFPFASSSALAIPDSFQTPTTERFMPQGILGSPSVPMSEGPRGLMSPSGGGRTLERAKRPTVSWSPHTRHHPYNPSIRISTSLKPLPSPHAAILVPSTAPFPPSPSPAQPTPSPLQNIFPNSQSCTPKSILKRLPFGTPIRVAPSVEAGTRGNAEEARARLGGGRRRGLVAMDSFQLATKQARGGVEGVIPGSDDSTGSGSTSSSGSGSGSGSADGEGEEAGPNDGGNNNDNDPAPESTEIVSETSTISSLLDTIISSHIPPSSRSELDLLSIEDAYTLLSSRLRELFSPRTPGPPHADQENAIAALRIRSAGVVGALRRDIGGLVGKPPGETTYPGPPGDFSSSPTMAGQPMVDPFFSAMATNTPTPSPPPASKPADLLSPQPRRQGYSDEEVKTRRASAGVGQSALKFTAFLVHKKELFECFSDPDLTSVLSTVLVIPATPKLHTPNSKKTFALAVYVFTSIRVPKAVISPVVNKLIRALTSAVGDAGLNRWGGGPGKKAGEGGNVKARLEGYGALANALSQYPGLFVPAYEEIVPALLKGLVNPTGSVRARASAAVGAMVRGRIGWVKGLEGGGEEGMEEWKRARGVVRASEVCALNYLRSSSRRSPTNKTSPSPAPKAPEWNTLEQMLVAKMDTDPHWVCATWAVLVSLLGTSFIKGNELYKQMYTVLQNVVMAAPRSPTKAMFSKIAWDHTIHAIVKKSASYTFQPDTVPLITYELDISLGEPFSELDKLAGNLRAAMMIALKPAKEVLAKIVTETSESGVITSRWVNEESVANQSWMRTCYGSTVSVVYAYTGAILECGPSPVPPMDSTEPAVPVRTDQETKMARLDRLWRTVVQPQVSVMVSLSAMDEVKTTGWGILAAIVSSTSMTEEPWNLDNLLSDQYVAGTISNTEVTSATREQTLTEMGLQLVADAVTPQAIPGWGSAFICMRFSALVKLLEASILRLRGVMDVEAVGPWVRSTEGLLILPVVLSNVWRDLLSNLLTVKDSNNLIYQNGLKEMARFIADLHSKDALSYLPPSLQHASGYEPDVIRIGMTQHLFEVAVKVLGQEVLSRSRLAINAVPSHQAPISLPYGSDKLGNPTPVGALLTHILCMPLKTLNHSRAIRVAYLGLIETLLDVGTVEPIANRLLGDISNSLPGLLPGSDLTRLGVWRLLCPKWVEHTEQTAEKAVLSTSNNTGSVLVGMLWTTLLNPEFVGGAADESSLEAWDQLLAAAVRRACLKPSGSNLGVLEELTGHLTEVLGKTGHFSVSYTTLCCLKSALGHLQFNVGSQTQQPPQRVNQDYIPKEFLGLISRTITAHSSANEAGQTSALELLECVVQTLRRIPVSFVEECLGLLLGSVNDLLGLQDGVSEEMHLRLDQINLDLLALLQQTISPTTSALRVYSVLMMGRLGSRGTEELIAGFKTFWAQTFAKAEEGQLEYEEDTKAFLVQFKCLCNKESFEATGLSEDIPRIPGESQLERTQMSPSGYEADVSREQHFTQLDRLVPTVVNTPVSLSEPINAIAGPSHHVRQSTPAPEVVADSQIGDSSTMDHSNKEPKEPTEAQPQTPDDGASSRGRSRSQSVRSTESHASEKRARKRARVAQRKAAAKQTQAEAFKSYSAALGDSEDEEDCIIISSSLSSSESQSLGKPAAAAQGLRKSASGTFLAAGRDFVGRLGNLFSPARGARTPSRETRQLSTMDVEMGAEIDKEGKAPVRGQLEQDQDVDMEAAGEVEVSDVIDLTDDEDDMPPVDKPIQAAEPRQGSKDVQVEEESLENGSASVSKARKRKAVEMEEEDDSQSRSQSQSARRSGRARKIAPPRAAPNTLLVPFTPPTRISAAASPRGRSQSINPAKEVQQFPRPPGAASAVGLGLGLDASGSSVWRGRSPSVSGKGERQSSRPRTPAPPRAAPNTIPALSAASLSAQTNEDQGPPHKRARSSSVAASVTNLAGRTSSRVRTPAPPRAAPNTLLCLTSGSSPNWGSPGRGPAAKGYAWVSPPSASAVKAWNSSSVPSAEVRAAEQKTREQQLEADDSAGSTIPGTQRTSGQQKLLDLLREAGEMTGEVEGMDLEGLEEMNGLLLGMSGRCGVGLARKAREVRGKGKGKAA